MGVKVGSGFATRCFLGLQLKEMGTFQGLFFTIKCMTSLGIGKPVGEGVGGGEEGTMGSKRESSEWKKTCVHDFAGWRKLKCIAGVRDDGDPPMAATMKESLHEWHVDSLSSAEFSVEQR